MSIEPKFKKGNKVWGVTFRKPLSSSQSISVFEGTVIEIFEVGGRRGYRVEDRFFYEENLFADVRDALASIKSKYYDYIRQYVTDIEDVIKDLEKQIKEQEGKL